MVNLHRLVLVIIQNLNNSIFKIQHLAFKKLKNVFTFVFVLNAVFLSAQEISEETTLKFQGLFFDALTQKAIHNYDNAIDKLEKCNELIPNEKSVLFELSKNYAFLNKHIEAIEFANKTLAKVPENIWVLEHLVSVYKADKDFNQAIKLQQQIALKYPKKKRKLVFLYLQNKDREAAKKVLNELAVAKMLNRRLRKIKATLEGKSTKQSPKKTIGQGGKRTLKDAFEQEKNFQNLKYLLSKLATGNNPDFLKYSEEGLMLFPAQPFVYLMNGKALNTQKKYKKAVSSLKNGIDFVIDDKQMEVDFYKELIKAYQGLGDSKNLKKYKNKL